MSGRALLVVDMLADFVEGALGSERSRAIVPAVAALVRRFAENGETVVFACDAHEQSDPEIALWGAHALKLSDGASVSPALLALTGPQPGAIFHAKRGYDAFAGGNLAIRLRHWGIDEAVIVGTCTHICVAQSAIGAFQAGLAVSVVSDAVAGFPDTDEAFWLDHIRAKGNEATHEIPSVTRPEAEELLNFVGMLLKFVFEMPAQMAAKAAATRPSK